MNSDGFSQQGCLIIILIICFIIGAPFAFLFTILLADDEVAAGQTGFSECGFNIHNSVLSKSQFVSALTDYYNSLADGRGHKSTVKIFVDDAAWVYDKSLSMGINPEMVIVRAYVEGYSPSGHDSSLASYHNYWGYRCYNGKPLSTCKNFDSFRDGVETYLNNISQYDSLLAMMSRYASIGDYWYNPGSSGLGGCYYASYIYPDGVPQRVKDACSQSKSGTCTKSNTSSCVKTTEEDNLAYANYQIAAMAKVRKTVFGLDESTTCTNNSGNTSNVGIVNWMISIANDNTHGYSQKSRNLNPDVDCSSFVYYALLNNGFTKEQLGSTPFGTKTNEKTILKSNGFVEHQFVDISSLQSGDILWRYGHTEVYAGDGKCVGAHGDYDGKIGDTGTGSKAGDEVSVKRCSTNWTYYYRLGK